MTLTSSSIEGNQLSLCKDNVIFCHVDCFCLQGNKRKIKPEVFCVSSNHSFLFASVATMT